MDQTQPHYISLDRASEPEYSDPDIIQLYTQGSITRAEADIFQIIAAFNDEERNDDGTGICCIG